MLQRLREPVSGITHFAGALFALIGGIWLIILTYPNISKMLVTGIYSFTMFLGFMTSTVMHSYIGKRRIIRWLIRLDHAAIFLMIAGTYTPITYAFLQGNWRWLMLGTVWVIAIIGAIWKLLYWKRDTIWQTMSYFVFVIVAFVMLPDVLPQMSPLGVRMLIGGSAMYIVGAVVFAARFPNINKWWGYHEIWHLFVLAGAALHFGTIAYAIIT